MIGLGIKCDNLDCQSMEVLTLTDGRGTYIGWVFIDTHKVSGIITEHFCSASCAADHLLGEDLSNVLPNAVGEETGGKWVDMNTSLQESREERDAKNWAAYAKETEDALNRDSY
jgi:hypothetical protein